MDVDVDAYLDRIAYQGSLVPSIDSLTELMGAHLSTVPFENLHVYRRLGVRTDTGWSLDKIVGQGRGGWCFENNGAFAALLEALGFEVIRLGAAVLLDGPNEVIDHLTIEVVLDEPYLVDVGFGDSFMVPLKLNSRELQFDGLASWQFIPSAQGLTLTKDDDGVPAAQFRFKRVTRSMSDFDAASTHLQTSDDLHWRHKPFATRLIDGGPDRVTLLTDRLRLRRNGEWTESPVPESEWDAVLEQWFSLRMP